MEYRHAAAELVIDALLVHDRIRNCGIQGSRLLRRAVAVPVDQVSQVHQVEVRVASAFTLAEGLHIPAVSGQGVQGVVRHGRRHLGEEPVNRLAHRLHFAQIQHGKGVGLALVLLLDHLAVEREAAVHHLLRGFQGSRVFNAAQPSVVQAELAVLGSDVVLRIGGHGIGKFRRSHQTGMHGDQIDALFSEYAAAQCLDHLLRRQIVFPMEIIAADAVQRSAAVIPQHQVVGFGRVLFRAQVQEGGQGFRLSHVGLRKLLRHKQGTPLALAHVHHGQGLGAQPGIPFSAAAAKDNDVDLVLVEAGGVHLGNHPASGSGLQFQVRSAHVDHDGHLFPGRFRAGADAAHRQSQDQKQADPGLDSIPSHSISSFPRISRERMKLEKSVKSSLVMLDPFGLK